MAAMSVGEFCLSTIHSCQTNCQAPSSSLSGGKENKATVCIQLTYKSFRSSWSLFQLFSMNIYTIPYLYISTFVFLFTWIHYLPGLCHYAFCVCIALMNLAFHRPFYPMVPCSHTLNESWLVAAWASVRFTDHCLAIFHLYYTGERLTLLQ